MTKDSSVEVSHHVFLESARGAASQQVSTSRIMQLAPAPGSSRSVGQWVSVSVGHSQPATRGGPQSKANGNSTSADTAICKSNAKPIDGMLLSVRQTSIGFASQEFPLSTAWLFVCLQQLSLIETWRVAQRTAAQASITYRMPCYL